MRRFALLFGATAPATAATLAAVFLGFGFGSATLGRWGARLGRDPLRAFGLLEAGVGLSALLVEPILGLYGRLYPFLHLHLAHRFAALLVLKLALAMAAVFVPTFLMGGTLPVLARAVARKGVGLGVSAGGLYAANTLGAAAGALAVPFLLLPALGARGTLASAVLGSLLVGAVAFRGGAEVPNREPEPKPGTGERPAGFLLALSFLSGALALGLEALWTRMFELVHENSLYSFAVVVAIFLLGLATGAALARAALRRGWASGPLTGLSWALGGLLVLISPNLFLALSGGLSYVSASGGFLAHAGRIAAAALLTLLPATLCLGAVFPLLLEATRATGRATGPAIGWLLGANTLGAIAGPLAATFLLTPRTGLWWAIALVGAAMVLAGALAHAQSRKRARALLPAYGALLLLLPLLAPGALPRVRLAAGERIVDLADGSFGTVAVVEDAEHRAIKVNNYYLLGGTTSTGDERLQAHLPLLLHPSPKRVAFLGMGTGITAGGALFHPVEKVVVVELVPEVVAAARDHFQAANRSLVTDPRVEVVTEDARTYLAGSGERFDVIVGDLFVPWRRGEAALYTEESFAAARQALARGGLFCQWLPLFQLSAEDFQSIEAGFLRVFPHAILWRGDLSADEPAVALLGQREGTPLDPEAIDARVRTMASGTPDPASPYLVDPAGLWMFLVGPLAAEASSPPRINTDDSSWVELHAPRLALGAAVPATLTGEALAPFLDAVRRRPLAGTPLARLDAAHLEWRDAGADLGRATLLSVENRQAEADALAGRALAALPAPLRDSILASLGGAPR